MDLLPPPEDDPYSEPLQITPDQLRQHLYGLSFDSAAGNTGWTNSMLYAFCNDRATSEFQAGLTPPSSIICAFCTLGNDMLLGKIKGLVVTSSSVPDSRLLTNLTVVADLSESNVLAGGGSCKVAMLTIGPHLRPLQLGGGLSHGAGIDARMSGLFLHR